MGAMPPPLWMILALGRNGELGRAGHVPWDYPEDRAFFANTTRGHAVIMGRRTWEERGKPLPRRMNVVVSRSVSELAGATVVPSLEGAVAACRGAGRIPIVIGGERLYAEALPAATLVFLTEIPEAPADADVFFLLDRTPFSELASWHGARGERYVVLRPR